MGATGMRAVNRDRGTEVAGRVERADTFWTRLKGLQGRREFAAGEGLWIVPCRSIHTLGMTFPIDVLFLNDKLQVTAKEENLRPGRLTAIRWKARTVLELPAGTLNRTGTEVGDRIEMTRPEERS